MILKNYVFSLATLTIVSLDVHPIFAHKVKISEDVGATLHIEPNDNPRAGEVSQIWLAMTRKGGKLISLDECNCKLSVYKQPYKAGDSPLVQPKLKPLNVEKYQNTPSAEINFPQVGAYYLELSGKPISEGSFKPFAFKFDVTVATGRTTPSVVTQVQNTPKSDVTDKNGSLIWVIIAAGLSLFLLCLILFRRSKK